MSRERVNDARKCVLCRVRLDAVRPQSASKRLLPWTTTHAMADADPDSGGPLHRINAQHRPAWACALGRVRHAAGLPKLLSRNLLAPPLERKSMSYSCLRAQLTPRARAPHPERSGRVLEQEVGASPAVPSGGRRALRTGAAAPASRPLGGKRRTARRQRWRRSCEGLVAGDGGLPGRVGVGYADPPRPVRARP